MISIEQARDSILAGLTASPVELLPLPDAWNRVLARDIAARVSHPPADVSAMDGYAVRGADAAVGRALRLVGEAAAGHPFAGEVGPDECVRIFTGSVVPPGADAILIQENAARDGSTVVPTEPVAAGRHIRGRGQDFAPGTVLVSAGRRLGARDIGLVAAGNQSWVSVHRRPRILVVATGDEILLPGEPETPGSVYNSNTPMLAALIRGAGAEPVVTPPVPDRIEATAAALSGIVGIDLVVTIGGASVGDHDLVKDALAASGFELGFWRIAMRPGKPLLHGTIRARDGRIPVLGLPGNAVSAMVCALRFLLPAIRRLSGEPDDDAGFELARLTVPLPANDHRADHLRAVLDRAALHRTDGALAVAPNRRQDSGMLRDLARADALILRPPHAPAAEPGTTVPIIRLDRLGL
ncbi:MAG: molybdopterin molybdotransferase MoeA [Gluconacetobacter diazotrophicus]|nr:molybdopterin molybdotransferase MoeA [Gluconacetobacter diazotrophicus]